MTEHVISPKGQSISSYFRKLWIGKSMISALAYREFKVRYAQTYLGIIWAFLNPIFFLGVFTLFFNKIIQIPGVPKQGYIVYTFSGLICWNLFSGIVHKSGLSLLEEQEIVKKVYAPKLTFLLSKILVVLIDFGISLLMLSTLLIIKNVSVDWTIVFFPLVVLLNILVGLSFAIWVAILSFKLRDLQQFIPYILSIGIWLSPVFYSSSILPKNIHLIAQLNPMYGIIELFRWMIWNQGHVSSLSMLSILFFIALLFIGIYTFIKLEHKIADVL